MNGMGKKEIKSREGVAHFSSAFSASYGISCSYNVAFWIGPAFGLASVSASMGVRSFSIDYVS